MFVKGKQLVKILYYIALTEQPVICFPSATLKYCLQWLLMPHTPFH